MKNAQPCTLNKPGESNNLVNETAPDLPEHFLGTHPYPQILNNLLSNAIKFTDAGTVKIRTSWSGGSLRLEVIDTDHVERRPAPDILTVFPADTDTTASTAEPAGLTLCRQLVERMHGQILVDSGRRRNPLYRDPAASGTPGR